MPITPVVFFKEANGTVPFLEWFDCLPEHAKDQCLAKLTLLGENGHELRRPAAENLGGGIYELRAKSRNVNYRMLYFFHGREAAVVSHGIQKQQEKVPAKEIALAKARMAMFRANPKPLTFEE
jgi:phage-related protein